MIGAFFRFFACIGDLALTYTLYIFLLSFEQFRVVNSFVSDFFVKDLSVNKFFSFSVSTSMVEIIVIYAIYVLFRFYSTLIFGVSFTQFFIGLKGNNTFIWNRIGGAMRVLLELPLTPFIFFDLPGLKNRKTFKEVLTFTEVVIRERTVSLFLTAIAIPIFLVISVFSPLLENLSLIDGIKVKITKEGKETISNGSNFDNFKTYESNYLAMSTFSSLSDNRFLLLPVFEISKKKRNNSVSTYLMVYDRLNFISGHFRVIKRISLFNLLDKGRKKFGFWDITYPNLFNVLSENRYNYLPKKFNKSFGAIPFLDQKVQQDISSLIKDSFELGLPTLIKHAQDKGPFIRSHIVIRNELLALFDEGSVFEIDINQLGSSDFLQMKQKFAKSIKENLYYEVFIPLFTNNGSIFQISFPGGKDGNDSRAKFKETFFSVVKWYFDYKEVFPVPTDENDYSPLRILDHYVSSTRISQKEKNILQKYIYKYYYEICQQALKDNDKNLVSILIFHLDRYWLVAQMMNQKFGKDYYSDNFLKSLKLLKLSLKENDFGFFEIKRKE